MRRQSSCVYIPSQCFPPRYSGPLERAKFFWSSCIRMSRHCTCKMLMPIAILFLWMFLLEIQVHTLSLCNPGLHLQWRGINRSHLFNPGAQDRLWHSIWDSPFFLRDVIPKWRLWECSTCFLLHQVAQRRVKNRAGTCATESPFHYNPGLSRAPMTFCSSSNINEMLSWMLVSHF